MHTRLGWAASLVALFAFAGTCAAGMITGAEFLTEDTTVGEVDVSDVHVDLSSLYRTTSDPLDVRLTVTPNSEEDMLQSIYFALSNETEEVWQGILIELGTGSGASFQPGPLEAIRLDFGFGPQSSTMGLIMLNAERMEFGGASTRPGEGINFGFEMLVSDGLGGTGYEVTLRFTPLVPTPGVAALLLPGAAVLGLRRGRRG